MEALTINIGELKGHPKNPKLHTQSQVEHIKKSIEKFGFTQPVVIDDDNMILVGHARTEAARQLSLNVVPAVRIRGLSEEQKLALMASDNQLAQETSLDSLKLEAIMSELNGADFPMADFGFAFEPHALEDMCNSPMELNEGDAGGGSIKQIVILLDGDHFETVLKKLDGITKREPTLTNHTTVFMRLLDIYEESAH